MTNIAQIMTRDLATCGPSSTLNDAAQRMWERDIGVLPVTDERGCPVGVITDRDIAMAAYTQGRPLGDIPVSSAMSHGVFSVREDATIGEAQRVMQQHQIRRVPVIDAHGRAVGIVSLNDMALSVGTGRKASDKSGEMSPSDVVSTLRAVCQPRSSSSMAAAAAE